MLSTCLVSRDSRKPARIQSFNLEMEFRWLVSLVIPVTWACPGASGRSHHARAVSDHTWAAPLLDLPLPDLPLPGSHPCRLGLGTPEFKPGYSSLPQPPPFPAYPPLKVPHSAGQTFPWVISCHPPFLLSHLPAARPVG